MTIAGNNENQNLNEPQRLESEGYLNRAWRRLGEGLAPYVAGKTGDDSLKETRDVYTLLSKMVSPGTWDAHFRELGHSGRGWVNQLRDFRNGPWAHLAGYSDDDVLHYIGVIVRLLEAISATKQAQVVAQMYNDLGKLIFSSAEPERTRNNEITELQQRILELESEKSDMQSQNLRLSGQMEGQ